MTAGILCFVVIQDLFKTKVYREIGVYRPFCTDIQEKGRNYAVFIYQGNGRKMGRFHDFDQEIVQSGKNYRSGV